MIMRTEANLATIIHSIITRFYGIAVLGSEGFPYETLQKVAASGCGRTLIFFAPHFLTMDTTALIVRAAPAVAGKCKEVGRANHQRAAMARVGAAK